jgi:DNA mismatch endonuclease (patch repair protein)
MSRVGSRDTTPEKLVRSAAHRLGYRFRLHAKNLPGKPDLVFVARRKVVFVHGCFWHGHRCAKGRAPKSNQAFWNEKIRANRKRDRRNNALLRAAGWNVLVLWQCELKEDCELSRRLVDFLG